MSVPDTIPNWEGFYVGQFQRGESWVPVFTACPERTPRRILLASPIPGTDGGPYHLAERVE